VVGTVGPFPLWQAQWCASLITPKSGVVRAEAPSAAAMPEPEPATPRTATATAATNRECRLNRARQAKQAQVASRVDRARQHLQAARNNKEMLDPVNRQTQEYRQRENACQRARSSANATRGVSLISEVV